MGIQSSAIPNKGTKHIIHDYRSMAQAPRKRLRADPVVAIPHVQLRHAKMLLDKKQKEYDKQMEYSRLCRLMAEKACERHKENVDDEVEARDALEKAQKVYQKSLADHKKSLADQGKDEEEEELNKTPEHWLNEADKHHAEANDRLDSCRDYLKQFVRLQGEKRTHLEECKMLCKYIKLKCSGAMEGYTLKFEGVSESSKSQALQKEINDLDKVTLDKLSDHLQGLQDGRGSDYLQDLPGLNDFKMFEMPVRQ